MAGTGLGGVLLTALASFKVPPEGVRFGPTEFTVLVGALALALFAIVTLYSALIAAKDTQYADLRQLYEDARPLQRRLVAGLERSASISEKAVEKAE